MRGLAVSRGNADVRYQCQGDVPQAEAPCEPGGGNTFERNAAASGQRRRCERQMKVSIDTVKASPATVAVRRAGRRSPRIVAKIMLKESDERMSITKQCPTTRRATSARKMIVAMVIM